MSFFRKVFGRNDKSASTSEKKDPENTRLNYLLNIWGEHPSDENYKIVVEEILNGNSYLILPSVNDDPGSGNWETAKVSTTLKLTSIFNLDGLKVLGAFSDEKSLVQWTKRETQYTAISTQDMVEFCKANGIDRIVINSGQKNMFVLERNRDNIKTTVIDKSTPVQVGAPIHPLSRQILDKLIANFKKVDTIKEAYHYAQNANNEFSLVIGVVLSAISDNSRAALNNAINSSLQGEKLDTPVDIFVLPTDDWIKAVRNIQNSLFYKR